MLASVMPHTHGNNAEAQLTLRSQLADLALVWPWVDALAIENKIPDNTRFGIDLCLEEALSNVIRHGYRGEPDHSITVNFTVDEITGLTFTIEDQAPPFAPVEPPELQETRSLEEITPGGQGIRLMLRFARTLVYEQLPNGNRLTLGFPRPQTSA
jgi:anti-sigma regulatory factor (Ser/Thr protein kinase)